MSIVYEGVDERLKRPIAIKILHPFLAERLEYRSRFLREAEAVARLTHPNIVQIFDVSSAESNTELYIVTELLVGETLREFNARVKLEQIPELSAMIIWEIAGALEHAHKRGIIHRDIKPENIMICRDGQIKLMDFGIASIGSEESLTQSGTLLGSLAHVSPEVIKGERATFASDLYSLSTVFYWLLSDQLPFNGDSPHALLKAIVDVDAKSIQTLSPFVSDELAAVVEKGMNKNPSARFQSALEMAEAIEASLRQLGIAIDTKRFHHVLKDPDAHLGDFKNRITESIKQKLLVYEQQKNDSAALALQCRLGAAPFERAKPRSKKRAYLFAAMASVFFVFGLAAYVLLSDASWIEATLAPPGIAPIVEETQHREEPVTAPLFSEPTTPEIVATQKKEAPPKLEPQAAKAPVFRTVEIVVWPFATISLNGNIIARDTKSIILKLEGGTHKLTFTHTYAATVEKIVKVTEGQQPIEVRVSLDKSKPAFLVVKSNVESDVAVDGSYRGTAKKSLTKPIVIPMPDKSHAQKREVIVSQDNFAPLILETEFVAGQTKEIEVKLTPLPGDAKSLDAAPTPNIKKLY